MKSNTGIKAILHDWDDTVTNSFLTYSKWYVEFANKYNLAIPSKKQIKQSWGNPVPVMINLIWNQISINQAQQMLYNFKENSKYNPTSHTGVVDTLINFANKGYKLGIISSAPKFKLTTTYNQIFTKNIHSLIYGEEDLDYVKPNPKVFEKPLKFLNLNCNQVIYIGDSLFDYFAARDAGIIFYAVTTGITTKNNFIKAGLNNQYILNSFLSIYDLV